MTTESLLQQVSTAISKETNPDEQAKKAIFQVIIWLWNKHIPMEEWTLGGVAEYLMGELTDKPKSVKEIQNTIKMLSKS